MSSSPLVVSLGAKVLGSILTAKVLWMTGMAGSGLPETLEQSDGMWGGGGVFGMVILPGYIVPVLEFTGNSWVCGLTRKKNRERAKMNMLFQLALCSHCPLFISTEMLWTRRLLLLLKCERILYGVGQHLTCTLWTMDHLLLCTEWKEATSSTPNNAFIILCDGWNRPN